MRTIELSFFRSTLVMAVVMGSLAASILPVLAQGGGSSAAGLWVGEAYVMDVEELTPGAENNPDRGKATPAGSVLTMRLLLHVDESGNAQLLKWVSLMAEKQADDSYKPILVTRKSRFFDAGVTGLYPGDDQENSEERAGYRYFTTSYDWETSNSSAGNQLEMSGTFGQGSTLSALLYLSAQNAVNPFYHRYHQQHYEGREVSRRVEISIGELENHGGTDATARGVYRERIHGLHGEVDDVESPSGNDPALVMEGVFALRRVSIVGTLN